MYPSVTKLNILKISIPLRIQKVADPTKRKVKNDVARELGVPVTPQGNAQDGPVLTVSTVATTGYLITPLRNATH